MINEILDTIDAFSIHNYTILWRADPGPSVLQEPDQDILSQLTALRQQLKNEENKIKSQLNHTNVQV